MINNLFNYATKELSQDAFIMWLMSYSMENSKKDDALYECSQAFLREFIGETEKFVVNEIYKQFHNIDILLTVNGKYAIVIEDKTHTSQHGTQLPDYLKNAKEHFPTYDIIGIYFKTGFQSDYSEVEEHCYKKIDRTKIVEILSTYEKETDNDIFKNYFEYWNNYENEVQQFKNWNIAKWNSSQVKGFYDYLKRNNIANGDYGYVYNRSGGFVAFWFGKRDNYVVCGKKCDIYLQFQFENQELKLCLKVGIKDNEGDYNAKDIANELIYKRDENGDWAKNSDGSWAERLGEYNFIKPKTVRGGKTMTIGVYNENPQNANEAIDVLKRAMKDYEKFAEKFQKRGCE